MQPNNAIKRETPELEAWFLLCSIQESLRRLGELPAWALVNAIEEWKNDEQH